MVRAEAVLNAETRQLREIADRILAAAAAVDAAEDALYGPENRGDELPPELQDREARLAFLRKAKAALEAEAEAAETARREQMRAEGREPRTPPDGRDPFKPRPRAQRKLHRPGVEDHEDQRRVLYRRSCCFRGSGERQVRPECPVAAGARRPLRPSRTCAQSTRRSFALPRRQGRRYAARCARP